jgi:hypothetical protein
MLHLSFITGPGTYALGVNPSTTPGGEGSVGVVTGSDLDTWETWLTGSAGSVTITTRTSNRVAGTFQFTATANPGTPPGTKAVTAGEFDITVPGGLSPLPTDAGSTLVANLGGTAWNAATVSGTGGGGGFITAGGTSLDYALSLQPKVAMSAGNTYGVPSEIDIAVQRFDPGNSWNGGTGADVGSVTIITLDSDRLVATFSGTLPPATSGVPLVLTGGAINTFLQN